jgi:signal transduction histidine kinase
MSSHRDAPTDPAPGRGGASAARADGETLDELAAEHLGLRRIAELVARGAPEGELFEAVAIEASRLINEDTTLLRVEGEGAYSSIAVCGGPAPVGTRFTLAHDDEGLLTEIARTRRSARRDDYVGRGGPAFARDYFGLGSAAAVPVIVDDRIWGILGATTSDGRQLPFDTEHRLAQFAELVAAALANAQARSDLQRMADEQTALRQVAELIARTAPTEEIFAAAAVNASRLLDGAPMTLTRFDGDRDLVVLATQGGPTPVGTRIAYEPGTLPDQVRRLARAVRVDDYSRELDAELAAQFNLAAGVSVPISVGSDVWGMLTATSDSAPVPAGTEERLLQFAGLVTAALANVQARTELQSLADEQAALRSVAELAAQDVPAEEVLAAVARQASRLTDVDFSTLLRFEPDGSTEIAALDGAPSGITVGMRAPATGDGATQLVWRTGRPARIDNLAESSGHWAQVAHGHGFMTSAAVPILSQGTLWGVLVVVGRDKPLPTQIHAHLTSFAELAATAIAAAQARRELQQLAEEQSALRRVAELVARGAALPEVFASVAVEASRLFGNLAAALLRYESAEVAVVVAESNSPLPIGFQVPATPGTPTGEVLRTARPFRIDRVIGVGLAGLPADFNAASRVVAVPISVEGRVWGNLSIRSEFPLAAATEDRLTHFAELAAAAVANAENKEKLSASRARVVATADETRRRLQRDVHDGAQQRLVHAIIALKLAKEATAASGGAAADLIDEALTNAQRANNELRDLVHGIMPAALTRGGLRAGIESLIADFPLPVEVDATVPRLPPDTETTAYFVVAEALTNVVKHAHAAIATVKLAINGDHLDVEVRDDGTGGADPHRGSGLTGLLDRIEASNGTLVLTSPAGAGTTLHAALPVRRRSPGDP